MYNAGVIGLGRIGCEFEDCHARAYVDCPDTQLLVMCDADKGKEALVMEKWGITQTFKEAHRKLDIVSICTPPESHRDTVEFILRVIHGLRAIYCEKPIAITLEDADDMIKTCHDRGVILQINHQRRFGRPIFYFSRGILNTGTHMFDLLRQYFGEIRSVNANSVSFVNGMSFALKEVDTDEPIFDLKFGGTILDGVKHLVQCIKEERQSVSSGEEARKALELCLIYQDSQLTL